MPCQLSASNVRIALVWAQPPRGSRIHLAEFYPGAKTPTESAQHGARLLRLFRLANLKGSVPTDLPARVTVFRGVRAATYDEAVARVRAGVSWTLSEKTAWNFAAGLAGYEPPPEFRGLRGFVGRGYVARDQSFAFFDDWRQESECVVNPSDVMNIEVSEAA